jgi:hypothetical protein
LGERGVSSDEDSSSKPSWSGDVASAAVDWSDMSWSSSLSTPRTAEVSSSRRPCATSSSPCSRGPADGPPSCGAQQDGSL